MAAKKLFDDNVCINTEGRYEVKLPWIEGHPPLSSNYTLSQKRLESTENKLRGSNYWEKYDGVFSEWIAENIIEEVSEKEVRKPAHYLPHHPVIKEASSTTKIRPVFDATAKEKGKPSSNDCLEKGVNLIEQIPALLLRFRKEMVGVTSDIKGAFLQIGLCKNDRDFLRFLWKTKDGVERIFRHRRVVFGVTTGPFLLGATIEHHLTSYLEKCRKENVSYSEKTIVKLLTGFYVDNCVTSVSDMDEIEVFIREATAVMAEVKFDLRGWEFSRQIDNEKESIPLLGLNWNKKCDTFSISRVQETDDELITKRIILSCAQSIFDPIGFTCPATLCPKLLLQEMWEEKISWDVEVKQDSRRRFEKWKAELPHLATIEIPRWINSGPQVTRTLTLHTFCDASQVAYGAVVFLRVLENGVVKIHLLQAKVRIAPIKKISIPRLELLAATVGACLSSRIQEVLGEKIRTYHWSDSTNVLAWIKRTDEWTTFIWNRVREIRILTAVDSWRHVPGEKNPADLHSRGCSPKQLVESKWWEGPSWLYESPEKWFPGEVKYDEEEVSKERKKGLVTTMVNMNEFKCFYKYFSRFNKTVWLIAWICRFAHNCKYPNNLKKNELSADEVDQAEKKLIKTIQQATFSKNDNRLATLNVLRDEDNILRLETKISRREDLKTFLYPYILPGQHPVLKKLIYDTHINSCHVGIQGLLCILRERYWIIGGRRIKRSVISICRACRRHAAKKLEDKCS